MVDENAPIEKNKLFVGNLHWNVRWQELKEFFGQWGEVAYASVALDRETRRSRGFGFVTFENEEDAAKAKEACVGETIQDREIFVEYARARSDEDENEDNNEEDESHEALEGEDKKVDEDDENKDGDEESEEETTEDSEEK